MKRLLSLTLLCAFFVAAAMSQDSPSGENQSPPRSDRDKEAGESSSRETRIDLSPPKDDAKDHPNSAASLADEDAGDSSADIQEFHPWDPHKAMKDIEVGDFYFKKKNYRAATDRYRDALIYKPNDAVAQYRLAECLDKTGNASEAVTHYQEYLKILPHGPFAVEAQKALERLKVSAAKEPS